MKTFTIANETNRITACATARGARCVAGAQRFATAAELQRLAADWPPARLIGIWNSLPGATPVRKFQDRATAVSRIWKAIQNLGEGAAEQATQQPAAVPAMDTTTSAAAEVALQPEAAAAAPVALPARHVAAEERPAKTSTSRSQKPPVAATKKGPPKGSKTGDILDLLNRPGGASLQQIMQATGWQAHSVRGFISGTLGRKMNLTVVSARTGDGARNYTIEA